MKVLVSGSEGFIGRYLVRQLVTSGYQVTGIDNFSKYGPAQANDQGYPGYCLIRGDAKDSGLTRELLDDCDHFIVGAALIGGLGYLNARSYDILSENERIVAASCDAAISAHRESGLRKITFLSSSMVFEQADSWPSEEGQELNIRPPRSAYGFQKLAMEYFARAVWEQYGLPYTILRPCNCVGVGETRTLGEPEMATGTMKMVMSHVVPDLVQKVLRGQDPLHILGSGRQIRHFTAGRDLARGIVMSLENPRARNEDFNLVSPHTTTVRDLAELIWRKVRGPDVPFRYISEAPLANDVQVRIPSNAKALELLGFKSTTTLDEMLDEVIPWVQDALASGIV
jgi:UDP-glucose 4-epimerase